MTFSNIPAHAGRLSLLVCLAAGCHTETPRTTATLPLRSIRLYETGVGYFERAGKLTQEFGSLPVPASHVDDALKTLVVLSGDDGARVSGVEFASVVSDGLARSLAGLPRDGGHVGYLEALESLRGLDVELRLPSATIQGKLIEIARIAEKAVPEGAESSTVPEPEGPSEYTFVVLARDGAIHRYHSAEISGIRALDPSVRHRLQVAVGALSERAAQSRRSLDVLATQAAPIRIGYVAETPVWRSSYRLILHPSGSRGTIEGWALLHNDTDETWKRVSIELVNGRPDSFLFPLSAPRYARRPLAEPNEALSTVPQLAHDTADRLWGDHFETGSIGLSGIGEGGGGSGYGYGRGRLGVASVTSSDSSGSSIAESSAIRIGDLAGENKAIAGELGALFSYRLRDPLTLRPHGSALVLFTQEPVRVERLTWFDEPSEAGRSGALVENRGKQTWPAGPIAIYESHGFVGETAIDRLKPSERAFLQFGADLDVALTVSFQKEEDHLKAVEWRDGRLVRHLERRHERRYRLTNRSRSGRRAYLVLGIVDNARVEGADDVDYDERLESPLAIFEAPPSRVSERTLHLVEALEQRDAVEALDVETLSKAAEAEILPDATRAALLRAAERAEAVRGLAAEKASHESKMAEVEADLERVRGHVAALGDAGGAGAANPLVARLVALEDRLSATRTSLETLDRKRMAELDAMRAELLGLSVPRS